MTYNVVYYTLHCMWTVLISRKAQKELDQAPADIQKKFEAWVSVVRAGGVAGSAAVNGYRDHALKGEWLGARSASLSKGWRVIYTVNNEKVTITVVRISKHDYR